MMNKPSFYEWMASKEWQSAEVKRLAKRAKRKIRRPGAAAKQAA